MRTLPLMFRPPSERFFDCEEPSAKESLAEYAEYFTHVDPKTGKKFEPSKARLEELLRNPEQGFAPTLRKAGVGTLVKVPPEMDDDFWEHWSFPVTIDPEPENKPMSLTKAILVAGYEARRDAQAVAASNVNLQPSGDENLCILEPLRRYNNGQVDVRFWDLNGVRRTGTVPAAEHRQSFDRNQSRIMTSDAGTPYDMKIHSGGPIMEYTPITERTLSILQDYKEERLESFAQKVVDSGDTFFHDLAKLTMGPFFKPRHVWHILNVLRGKLERNGRGREESRCLELGARVITHFAYTSYMIPCVAREGYKFHFPVTNPLKWEDGSDKPVIDGCAHSLFEMAFPPRDSAHHELQATAGILGIIYRGLYDAADLIDYKNQTHVKNFTAWTNAVLSLVTMGLSGGAKVIPGMDLANGVIANGGTVASNLEGQRYSPKTIQKMLTRKFEDMQFQAEAGVAVTGLVDMPNIDTSGDKHDPRIVELNRARQTIGADLFSRVKITKGKTSE